jgi:hypothetical protein
LNHLGDLKSDQRNARKHNERNIKQIVDSLQEVGAARSIVIDENNIILAGNGVTEAAAIAGIENVRIIEANGNEIIAVRRSGLTDEQKTRLALWDNRAAELAEWDMDVLANLYQEDASVFDNMFSAKELENIIGDLGEKKDAEPQIDRAAELNEKWQVQTGDLYIIGNHRLLCGDSTKREDVERVMNGEKADMVFTDPPYGLGGYGGRNNMELQGDDQDCNIFYKVIPDAQEMYVWGNFKNLQMINYTPRDVIVWVKNNFGLGKGYRGQYELCFYKGEFSGSDSDIWEIGKDVQYAHPTQKPIGLAERAINNSNPDIILDIFLGSGSTMVACHQLNRKCY